MSGFVMCSVCVWHVKRHTLKNPFVINNDSNKRVFVIAFLQGLMHPFRCALSMAQMYNPLVSVDTGNPAQSDRCYHIHHPDKRKYAIATELN